MSFYGEEMAGEMMGLVCKLFAKEMFEIFQRICRKSEWHDIMCFQV